MITPPGPLAYERHALRWIIWRLMGEERNLDALSKHIPRIANVVANVMRIESAITSGKHNDETNALRKALRELTTERTDEEGDPTW